MMTNLTKTIIYRIKINLLLLFILGVGLSSTLYASQYNDFDEEKDAFPDAPGESNDLSNVPLIPSSTTNNTPVSISSQLFATYPNTTKTGDWGSDPTQKSNALNIVMNCLRDWQKVSNGETAEILKYLDTIPSLGVLVNAYHSVLDKYLHNADSEVYRYINQKAIEATGDPDFASSKSYLRNQRISGTIIHKASLRNRFAQDLLDSMHAYLVHGYDSGHRYRKLAKQQNIYKTTPQFGNGYSSNSEEDEFKNDPDDDNNNIVLAQESWITIAKWKKAITQQRINQDRSSKFHTGLHRPIAQKIATEYQKTGACPLAVRLYYWKGYKNSTEQDICYNTQHNHLYKQKDLYVGPAYGSFKDEMLANDISSKTWQQAWYEAGKVLSGSNILKAIKANDEWGVKYGIPKAALLSNHHVLAILFYTNFTQLCSKFNESFRYISSKETLKELIQRNSKWCYLAKYLREVVEVFGSKIGKGSYYHGITATLFLQPHVYFYGPLSTSGRLEVATLFTSNDGFTVALTKGTGVYDSSLRYFNVGLVSRFSAENELLFMGGCLPIQISSIYLSQLSTETFLKPLFILEVMLNGGFFNGMVTHLDAAMFKQLASKKKVPFYAQKVWNQLRTKQQQVKLNMVYMRNGYRLFMLELFSSSNDNVLLLHKFVELFPNVTKITCEHTDNLTGTGLESGYSSDVVDDNFIIALKNCLSLVEYNNLGHQLKIITISTTWNHISCDLYVEKLASLGWAIEVDRNMQISLTKKSYDTIWTDIIYKGVIPQIKSLIKAGYNEKSTLNISSTIPLLGLLATGSKSIPLKARNAWSTFSDSQKILEVNMSIMYKSSPLFIPVFFSSGKLPNNKEYKNLLLIDQIAQLFPKATQIRCIDVDRVGPKPNDYSPSVVSSAFIYALLERLKRIERLKKISKHYRLQKITFITSFRNPIKDPHLDSPEFQKLQWNIGKGQKTIVVTRRPYPDCMEQIDKLISGQMPPNEPTSLDVLVFKQLSDASPEVPSNMQEKWAQFRRKVTKIKINTQYMYQYYKALASYFLYLDPKHKTKRNLLLVNTIMSIFPNVAKITCIQIDYVGRGERQYNPDSSGYSASVVHGNFIKSLANQLTQITHSNLQEITITMARSQEKYSLHTNTFKKAGWKIQQANNKKEIILKRRMYHDM